MAKKVPEKSESAQEVMPDTPESTALATQPTGEITTKSPDFFSDMGDELKAIYGASDQNVDNSEIQISRIGIVQPTSPEVTGQVEGWRGGMLYDNVLREVISYPLKQPWLKYKGVEESALRTVDSLIFLPILKLPTEYVKWPSKEERAGGQKAFHWKTLDVKEERVREGIWPNRGGTWKGKGSPPVTEHMNVVGAALDVNGGIKSLPIVLSFSRTSYQTGRKFTTFCQNLKLRGLPWWGVPQWLFCDKKVEEQGTYFILRFANGPTLQQLFPEGDVAKTLHTECFKLARELANPETGRAFQENLISAAVFATEDHDSDNSETTDAEFATGDPEF